MEDHPPVGLVVSLMRVETIRKYRDEIKGYIKNLFIKEDEEWFLLVLTYTILLNVHIWVLRILKLKNMTFKLSFD